MIEWSIPKDDSPFLQETYLKIDLQKEAKTDFQEIYRKSMHESIEKMGAFLEKKLDELPK